ncbi:hypothetical protein D9758_000780 [Tetrapyrgos nigripes]|uniref:Uncharacterized protein n=1 Tax=Tetrapyrgos nigripes TaxID=182062 RepID=A0A8H5GYI3_9AGAR|nr:hypothetical protein D9758_000780 [Tetrapyrgos nigripes]
MLFTSLVAVAFAVLPTAVLGANHDVTVGANNAFAFSPTTVIADAGDTITFTFVSRNHSATTASFDDPCPPPVGGFGTGGFDTGFVNAAGGATPAPVVVTIQDTLPHFVSCMQAAGAHCRAGMTLAINPTADQTYEQFLANALAS